MDGDGDVDADDMVAVKRSDLHDMLGDGFERILPPERNPYSTSGGADDLGDIGIAITAAGQSLYAIHKTPMVMWPFAVGVGCSITCDDKPLLSAIPAHAGTEWLGRAKRCQNTTGLANAEKSSGTSVALSTTCPSGEGLAPLSVLTITWSDQIRAATVGCTLSWRDERGTSVSMTLAIVVSDVRANRASVVFTPFALVGGLPTPSFARLRASLTALTVPIAAFGGGVPATATPLSFTDESVSLAITASGAATGMGFTLETLSIQDQRARTTFTALERLVTL
jgi:hypothetical protein